MYHTRKVRYCPKKCEDCKDWYNYTIRQTKTIKDKELRENLIDLWETLWDNNCIDFDIIAEDWASKL